VNVGDWVRLTETPPWVYELDFPEIQAVYEYAVGRTFEITGNDSAGRLELIVDAPDHPLGEQVAFFTWTQATLSRFIGIPIRAQREVRQQATLSRSTSFSK
jgi:hypothetical protein